MTERRSIK